MANEKALIWVDLEMTGLEPETDVILEIATLVTDSDLNTLAEGPVIAVHQSDSILENMNDWCKKTHGGSGLTERCRQSKFSTEEAEQQTLDFLKHHVPEGKSPMCGNSIGQDRRFLNRYMPRLEYFFHYRNIDVSTLKELARRWRPDILEKVKKRDIHLALEDIRDSINELKIYRELFFNLKK